MSIRNSSTAWGWPSILLHWLTALTVIGLFALGWWMVDLTYYSDWYHRAPYWHKSIGILLLVTVTVRLAWRLLNPVPEHEPGISRIEKTAANIAHVLLYVLLFATMLAGYFISTAEGDPVEVLGWFEIPALVSGVELFGMAQEDLAGEIHEYLAWSLVILAAIHAIGALKHHFIDRNRTLKRMLGIRK